MDRVFTPPHLIFSLLYYFYYYFVVLTIFNQSLFSLFFFSSETVHLQFDSCLKKDNQLLITENSFSVEMATTNKKKLANLNKEKCEEHPRSNLAQNSNVPRSQEDYITQVSEEIEGRVTKKLPQEFSKTENRILGALARLDDFLTNSLTRGHSGTAPETTRNLFSMNQGAKEDDSQSNPHPEAGIFDDQMTQNAGPEQGHESMEQKKTFNQSPKINISRRTHRPSRALRPFE